MKLSTRLKRLFFWLIRRPIPRRTLTAEEKREAKEQREVIKQRIRAKTPQIIQDIGIVPLLQDRNALKRAFAEEIRDLEKLEEKYDLIDDGIQAQYFINLLRTSLAEQVAARLSLTPEERREQRTLQAQQQLAATLTTSAERMQEGVVQQGKEALARMEAQAEKRAQESRTLIRDLHRQLQQKDTAAARERQQQAQQLAGLTTKVGEEIQRVLGTEITRIEGLVNNLGANSGQLPQETIDSIRDAIKQELQPDLSALREEQRKTKEEQARLAQVYEEEQEARRQTIDQNVELEARNAELQAKDKQHETEIKTLKKNLATAERMITQLKEKAAQAANNPSQETLLAMMEVVRDLGGNVRELNTKTGEVANTSDQTRNALIGFGIALEETGELVEEEREKSKATEAQLTQVLGRLEGIEKKGEEIVNLTGKIEKKMNDSLNAALTKQKSDALQETVITSALFNARTHLEQEQRLLREMIASLGAWMNSAPEGDGRLVERLPYDKIDSVLRSMGSYLGAQSEALKKVQELEQVLTERRIKEALGKTYGPLTDYQEASKRAQFTFTPLLTGEVEFRNLDTMLSEANSDLRTFLLVIICNAQLSKVTDAIDTLPKIAETVERMRTQSIAPQVV